MTNLERITQHNEELRECIDLVENDASRVAGNIPVEVSTAEDMEKILALATSADIGKAYIYTGESTEKYEKGAIYVITKAD